MHDKNGREIEIFSEVNVGEPDELYGDLHKNAFTGVIVGINEGTQTVVVIDQEDNAFEIESGRVEL